MRFSEKAVAVITRIPQSREAEVLLKAARPRYGKRYSVEFKISIDHVPYVIQAEGDDLEDLIQDATFNVDCPDPKEHLGIENLPGNRYVDVCETLASEVAAADEHARESRLDR